MLETTTRSEKPFSRVPIVLQQVTIERTFAELKSAFEFDDYAGGLAAFAAAKPPQFRTS